MVPNAQLFRTNPLDPKQKKRHTAATPRSVTVDVVAAAKNQRQRNGGNNPQPWIATVVKDAPVAINRTDSRSGGRCTRPPDTQFD